MTKRNSSKKDHSKTSGINTILDSLDNWKDTEVFFDSSALQH